MKKNFKRFFTLKHKANDGFTLVELIVVIAILAILGGVAVPAYSGYVKKANMQADISLASEVEYALTLAYYNQKLSNGGAVVLTKNGASGSDENVDAALIAAFGSVDSVGGLKYDGWKGVSTDATFAEAYLDSSYSGSEDSLINQVGSVTNLLKDALGSAPNLVGSSFNSYLTENGVDATDNQAVSNAAVLYAADTIGNMTTAQETAVNTAFQNFYDPNHMSYGNVGDLTLALQNELGTYGAVAAVYAHGEAFGQYVASNGNDQLLNDFHNINTDEIDDTEAALTQVGNNLGNMVEAAKTDSAINPHALQYIGNGQYAKDVKAYLESMKKIDANADKFTDKLDSEGCYTDGTAAALLQMAVSAGSAGVSCDTGEVLVVIDKDGITYNSITGIQG